MSHAKEGALTEQAAEQRQHVEYAEEKDALTFVRKFAASGSGAMRDLPRHVAALAGSAEVIGLMPQIAKHARGDVVLECAGALGMHITDQVNLALHASTQISEAALRTYLRQFPASTVSSLDEKAGLVSQLRKLLKGPLSVELPNFAQLQPAVWAQPHTGLLEWWLKTTNPTVVALELAGWADESLVEKLDAVAPKVPEAWTWLEHLHVAASVNGGSTLSTFHAHTKNSYAQSKLPALIAQYKPEAERAKAIPGAQADLARELTAKDDVALVDAAARTQGAFNVDERMLATRLRGESADVVFEVIRTMHAASIAQQIDLLEIASGPKYEFLLALLRRRDSAEIVSYLRDDKHRAKVRGMVGRSMPLRSLIDATQLESLHADIVRDEALRHWAYEDSDERNLLWLAAGSGPGAAHGCRLVQRERGSEWVRRLPANADREDARRFTLNSTDAAATKWVRENLLNDRLHFVPEDDNAQAPIDSATVGQGAAARLHTLAADAAPELVLARIADLNAAERAALLAKPEELHELLGRIRGYELRAVELIAPTLRELVRFPIRNTRALVDYTASRPATEQVAMAEEAGRARELLGEIGPFIALPALKQPALLAKALDDNEALLDWIFTETDASQSLAILAREPARKVAAELVSRSRTVYTGLPAYDLLRKSGREGFDAIARDIKDEDSKQEATDYQDGSVPTDRSLDQRASAVKDAVVRGNLPANIDAVLAAGGERADLIAVLQAATASQQVDLLGGSHERSAHSAFQKVRIGPQHLFPDLGAVQLLTLPTAVEWLVVWQQTPTALLHLVGHDRAAARALAKTLSTKAHVADAFATSLPRGAALTDSERLALDELANVIADDETLGLLFHARFDVLLERSYSLAQTRQLWSVLKRLPAAQVDQNVIQTFTHKSLSGPSGQWDKPNIDLEKDEKAFEKDDKHYERGTAMTAAEVKSYYGLDDAELRVASDPKTGWLIAKANMYVVKPANVAQFDATVIHEVGHSIDTMLGERTDLIYKDAGWHRYGYDQFEEWAAEMGAFDHVSASDRKQIVDVWQQALRSRRAVSDLVGSEHPAIANKQSPLSNHVDEQRAFAHTSTDLKAHNGKVFMQTPTSLASLKKQAWDAAPTHYSLTAPAEYFAECYVEYYRGYHGTPETAAQKGGRLPAWIKKWFDEHVDKIRFNPQRVRAGFDTP